MRRAGAAHFLKPHAQRLAAAMQADGHIVQRGAKARGQPVPRLAQDIGPPDDVGIFGLQRRQESVEAIAYGGVDLRVGVGG